MTAIIGNGISLRGIYFEDFQLPFYLKSGIVAADIGKAVALDSSAANTVKLAGADDRIIGRLEVVENRVVEGVLVGTVSVKFANRLPVKASLTGIDAVAVGDTVVGAGSGEVKALNNGTDAKTPDYSDNYVVALENSGAYAVVIKV